MPRTSIYRTSDPGRVTFAGRATAVQTEDSKTLDASQLRRIQDWMRLLAELEASTNALLAERTSRMARATVMSGKQHSRWYWLPEPETGCPALGPLALSWQDIFDTAQQLLRALVAAKPPRWCSGNDVVRWVRAIRWNVILLQDATNIRPVFRWPNDPPNARGWGTDADGSRGSLSTLLNVNGEEGRPYPHGIYGSQTPPFAVSSGIAALDAKWGPVETVTGYTPDGIALVSATTNGASFADQIWWTALDCAYDWATLQSTVQSFMLSPVVGDRPGQVVDLNPDAFARGATPSLSNAIDRYWRDLRPVKLRYSPRGIVSGVPWAEGVYFNPGRLIDEYVVIGSAFAALDLPTMLLDSIGFYVYNHLVYWRNRGVISLDETTLQRIQSNAASARMRQGLAPAGVIASIASSVNPVVGAVVSALQEIGFVLLDTLINQQLESDQPRRLFVRNYPSSCIGVEDSELSLATEEASIGGALSAREAQAEADRAAAAEIDASTEGLRSERARNVATPWKEIAIGVGFAAAVGLGVWALGGGKRT